MATYRQDGDWRGTGEEMRFMGAVRTTRGPLASEQQHAVDLYFRDRDDHEIVVRLFEKGPLPEDQNEIELVRDALTEHLLVIQGAQR